jgi:hypothetical protein
MITSKNLHDAALELPCEPPTLRILERFDEPINEPGVCEKFGAAIARACRASEWIRGASV